MSKFVPDTGRTLEKREVVVRCGRFLTQKAGKSYHQKKTVDEMRLGTVLFTHVKRIVLLNCVN